LRSNTLGQLFIFGFDGLSVNADARRLLTRELAAGVILFARNIASLEQVVELNHEIMNLRTSEFAPLISVDQEGGRVARLKNICTPIPDMRQIGTLSQRQPDLPYRLGAMMAREMVALGFHLDFAPILDVDTNPSNPIIGDRSFATDAHAVARIGAAFINGMQDAGLAACAKHFPGHGDTEIDSHLDLPILLHDQNRIKSVELVPFKASIKAGVASMMTAHILIPKLDIEFPATLSKPILQNLLREELKFNGVIFSDDLEMKAVADRYAMKEMIRLGLLAGVDAFLVCKEVSKIDEAIAALRDLVTSGEVPLSRVQEALKRVAALKRRFLGTPALAELSEAKKIVRSKPHLALAQNWMI
jgi:beta-N-acetylhexosaminidase